MIGKQYARVGSLNLVLVLIFAVLDGLLKGFDAIFYLEYVLLLAIFGLVAAHGTYFGRRLAGLAEAEQRVGSAEEARVFVQERHALQKVSFRISLLNILVLGVQVLLSLYVKPFQVRFLYVWTEVVAGGATWHTSDMDYM